MSRDDIAIGFTDSQRRWILERDGYRCQFRMMQLGHWVRCRNTKDLHVHHVVPRFWASLHYPWDFEINGVSNGITICAGHHVGKGLDIENAPYVIHADNIRAYIAYRNGNRNAFNEMLEARGDLARRGIPYWVTTWDMMLLRIAQREAAKFEGREYPRHRIFGFLGR